ARPRRCATAETGRQGGSDPLSALSPPAVLRGKDGRTRTGAGPAAGVLSRWSDEDSAGAVSRRSRLAVSKPVEAAATPRSTGRRGGTRRGVGPRGRGGGAPRSGRRRASSHQRLRTRAAGPWRGTPP